MKTQLALLMAQLGHYNSLAMLTWALRAFGPKRILLVAPSDSTFLLECLHRQTRSSLFSLRKKIDKNGKLYLMPIAEIQILCTRSRGCFYSESQV